MKKLFTSDKFFGAVTLLGIISIAVFCAVFFVVTPEMTLNIVLILVEALCIGVLYISYKKHSKNVMKGIMGALLLQMLDMSILCLGNAFGKFDRVIEIVALIMVTALFITHFIINSSHKPSPCAIRFNQVLCILYSVCMIADSVYYILIDESLVEKIGDAFSALAFICMAFSIVCVESRLDAYRLDREAAGWTEEKGYPKGYVHEYEKK